MYDHINQVRFSPVNEPIFPEHITLILTGGLTLKFVLDDYTMKWNTS